MISYIVTSVSPNCSFQLTQTVNNFILCIDVVYVVVAKIYLLLLATHWTSQFKRTLTLCLKPHLDTFFVKHMVAISLKTNLIFFYVFMANRTQVFFLCLGTLAVWNPIVLPIQFSLSQDAKDASNVMLL